MRRRVFGLRFAEESAERQYRAWRITNAIPFAQVGFIGSAPSWALFLVAVYLLEPHSAGTAGPAIALWVALLLALTLLTFWQRANAWIMPLAALANSVAGFLVAWLLYEVIGDSLATPVRAGVMTGGVLIVMNFGFAIFRIPPMMAVLAVTPYVAFATTYLYWDFQAGKLTLIEAGAFAAIQWIAYFGGLLVCIVIEAVNRRTFGADQIIQGQKRELQDTRDAIRRYLPPSVADQIIQGETASVDIPLRQRLTILSSDVVGFTEIADRVEPEVVTSVINEYMAFVSDIVQQCQGTVTEFTGDGVMALFGAPIALEPERQALQAVTAAQLIQSRLPELNRGWRKLGLGRELAIRIGINTGMVSVGSFGSRGRATYTAIGLQTNIAARLQASCPPGSILISDATYQLVAERIECRLEGEVLCKGLHYPVQAYVPVPAGEEPALAMTSHHTPSHQTH